MSYFPQKDSIYEIQPWAEQPSTLPNFILNTKKFIQTSISSKFQKKQPLKLEIAANTVYFIKNQQEESEQRDKVRTKYHRTTQNSPRFAKYQQQSQKANGLYKEIYRNLTQSSSKISKKQTANPEKKLFFHQTKNVIFDIKPVKKKGTLSSERLSLAGEEKQAAQKKQIKIYQKSTVAHEKKKKVRLQKREIDQICEKRKIKTESIKERSPLRIQLSSTMQFNQEKSPIQKLQKIKSIKSEMEKAGYRKQSNEKINFQLLVQRKLYLFNHKFENPQRGIKNSQDFRTNEQF